MRTKEAEFDQKIRTLSVSKNVLVPLKYMVIRMYINFLCLMIMTVEVPKK